MSLAKAEDLLQIIIEAYPSLEPEIRQLAGNEYVVVVDGTFIWSVKDWYEKFAPPEPVVEKKEEVEA